MTIRTEQVDVSFNLKLQKDLQEHEIICSHCGGTGLQVDNNPFGLKSENSKIHFPYKQQVIRGCNHCYNGVQSKCLHCGKIFERQEYRCDCEKSKQERIQEQYEKDLEIWNKTKKITLEQALNDYTLVYIDNYEKYLAPEEIQEYLEEKELEFNAKIERDKIWIYGTSVMDMSIDASDVIENACSDLHEEAENNIARKDIDELQTFLDQWCKNNSAGTTTYYADYKVGIVLEGIGK